MKLAWPAWRGPRRPWLRRALWVFLALVAAPHVLLLLYRLVPPLVTPLMLTRLVAGDGLTRDWVRLDEISPALVSAVIAAEDGRFCTHHGVDWTEMRSALRDYQADERARGASTITMQAVKNVVLWPGRDVIRKAIEVYLAHYVELIWPKHRIVEVYLNVAEWGPGVYGAEAAAQRYFRKPARRLTAREAALLAAVLPSPRRSRPDHPSPYTSDRAGAIQRRAAQLGPLLACVRGGERSVHVE
jgi:monofunctional biosynthetic peptidoglycan transglycosylase